MLALSDRRALKPLVEAIKNPATKCARGTLVYAMTPYNPVEYIFELVEVAVNDTLEASDNAIDIIEEFDQPIPEDVFDKCHLLIKNALKTAVGDRKDRIEYLNEFFDDSE